MSKKKVFCKDTLAVQSTRVMPNDTNSYGNMYGGSLLSSIDNVASISANRFTGTSIMTAALDSVNFLEPIPEATTVRLQSFVSGAGTRSIEVFMKVINEDLQTEKRKLAATAFITFVTVSVDGKAPLHVPEIVPESKEEIRIAKGYEKRVGQRKKNLQANKELIKTVSTKYPWE